MAQIILASCFRNFSPKKRKGVAEVISSLLLVVITVVGALILTSFLDETFVAGSIGVTSATDTSIKAIKLTAFDTRDGAELMKYTLLDNGNGGTDQVLCRKSCDMNPDNNPLNGGTEFMVIQIENNSLNPIFLKNVYLDSVGHTWDASTSGQTLDLTPASPSSGEYPRSGTFSILCAQCSSDQQYLNNEIPGGDNVNVLIKLDSINLDIPLSKTIRAQFNIGSNALAEFLVESGGAQ